MLPGSWIPLFCKVLFSVGQTIVFPRAAHRRLSAVSFNLAALYRDDSSTAVFLCLRFRTPSTSGQIGKCAPSRIHEELGYTPSRLYIVGQPTSEIARERATSRIPVERSLGFIGTISETCRATWRIAPSQILPGRKKEERRYREGARAFFLDQSGLATVNFVKRL